MKKALDRIKNSIIVSLIAASMYDSGTYIMNRSRDLISDLFPSRVKSEFVNLFRFPIYYSDKDVGHHDLFVLSDVVYRERAEQKFKLNSLRISSRNFLFTNSLELLSYILTTDIGHHYPRSDNITMKYVDFNSRRVLHHEIKHARTHGIDKTQELIEKWKKLSLDESGNTLYRSVTRQAMSRLKGLDYLIQENIPDSKGHESLGFVTEYARNNVYEDIAEVGTIAEMYPDIIAKWLGYTGQRNPIISEKIKLAQAHGIIPEEFTEYIELRQKVRDITVKGKNISKSQLKSIIKSSDNFLEKFPNSIYTGYLRNSRGDLILNSREPIENAVNEFKYTLRSSYKGPHDYLHALHKLSDCYSQLGDKSRQKIYSNGIDRYESMFYDAQLKILKIGVNDYLQDFGEEI